MDALSGPEESTPHLLDDDSDDEDMNDTNSEMGDEEEEAEELEWDLDTYIPIGWKLNTFETPSGLVMTRYQSPCGTYFGNLPQVLKFLDGNTVYSDFDRNLFKRRLEFCVERKVRTRTLALAL